MYVTIGINDVTLANESTIYTVFCLARPLAYSPDVSGTFFADVALLRLRNASFNPTASLAFSPNFNSSDSFVIAGWGHTEKQAFMHSQLRWASVPGIPYAKYRKWAQKYSEKLGTKSPFKMEVDHAAAGLDPDGLDSCVGDSGGPLILGGSNYAGSRIKRDMQVGIVSYGLTEKCGGSPGIGFYTKVGYWRRWIDDTLSLMNWRGYDTPSRQNTVQYKTCFNGTDIQQFPKVKAAGVCCEYCRKNSACAAWTWVAKDQICKLESDIGWQENVGECISGVMVTASIDDNTGVAPSTPA